MRCLFFFLLALCACGAAASFPSPNYVMDRLMLEGYTLDNVKGIQFYYVWLRERVQDSFFNKPAYMWYITPDDLPERYALSTQGRIDNYNLAMERVVEELREDYNVVLRGKTVACIAWGFKHDAPINDEYTSMCQD